MRALTMVAAWLLLAARLVDCQPYVSAQLGLATDWARGAPRFDIGNVQLFGTFGYYQAMRISIQATRFDDNLRQLMVGVSWIDRRTH